MVLCVLQAAVIRNGVASRAPRRSCCLRGGAWWETPLETLDAMRAVRTWRMVMAALCRALLPMTPPVGINLWKSTLTVAPQWLHLFPSLLLTPSLCFCNSSLVFHLWISQSDNSFGCHFCYKTPHAFTPPAWVLCRILYALLLSCHSTFFTILSIL